MLISDLSVFREPDSVTNYMYFWYFSSLEKFCARKKVTSRNEVGLFFSSSEEGRLWYQCMGLGRTNYNNTARRKLRDRIKKWKEEYIKRLDEIRGMSCVRKHLHHRSYYSHKRLSEYHHISNLPSLIYKTHTRLESLQQQKYVRSAWTRSVSVEVLRN